jgi:glycerol-3-phosphate O-acyltransferase 3/4
MQTVINDDFSKCFQSHPRDAWNFNFYLWPLWALGVLFRYSILFPIRLVGLLVGVILMIIVLLTLPLILRDKATLARYQRLILRWLCGVFVMSWTGVIKYHGIIPARRPNQALIFISLRSVLFVVFLNIPVFQIYVSNHTSMIDLLVLQQANTFAVVGQKHKGWIAWMQDHVLGCLGCIWFDRAQVANRDATAKAIRDHIHNENSNRLLIFPGLTDF